MDEINRYGMELIQKQVRTTGQICNRQKGRKIAVLSDPQGWEDYDHSQIATKYTLIDKKKVALITFDTYRVGAVEQLKIYAKIIGIPVDIVLSPSELIGVIERRKNAELILIDTAGRSHRIGHILMNSWN